MNHPEANVDNDEEHQVAGKPETCSSSGRNMAIFVAVVLTVAAVISASVCGTGHCGRNSDDTVAVATDQNQDAEEQPSSPGDSFPSGFRVRREWRELSQTERERVANAMKEMKNLDNEAGKDKYGPLFRTYDELILRHACTTLDPRCDQGHFTPAFMTFHRAILLEFENSLLSVDPEIGSMPYWNAALDSANGGKYYRVEGKWIFDPAHFGSYIGDELENHQVVDGLFADWEVSEYNPSNFDYLSNACINQEWFKGFKATTCDRCCGVSDCECDEEVDEFKTFMRLHDDCNPIVTRSGIIEHPNRVGGEYELQFSEEDFDACTDPNLIQSWYQWLHCNDISNNDCLSRGGPQLIGLLKDTVAPQLMTLPCGPESPACQRADARDATVNALNNIGDTCEIAGYYKDADGNTQSVNAHHGGAHFRFGGDMEDVATSPNDPLFFLYHANSDRSNMLWQYRTKDSLQEDLWHFPRNQVDLHPQTREDFSTFNGPFALFAFAQCGLNPETYHQFTPFSTEWWAGTTLYEVVTGGFPFDSIFKQPPANGFGYTHEEVILKTLPDNDLYSYDTIEEEKAIGA